MLFYSCLGLAGLFNALVFIITRMKFSTPFATWYYGLVISFHAFFISMFIFITIFNSFEKYDYTKVGPTLYGSMGLLLIWIIAWPVYYLINRFVAQPKVG